VPVVAARVKIAAPVYPEPAAVPAAPVVPPAQPAPAPAAAAPAPQAPAPAAAPAATPAPAPAPVAPPAYTPPQENLITVEGILDIDTQRSGNGSLLDPARNGRRRPSDVFIPKEMIRRFRLKQGSIIKGIAYPAEGRFPNPKMKFIELVDGIDMELRRAKFDFTQLTTISPDQQLKLESKDGRMTTRAIDLF
jgi:transcription termination factor Rho